MATAKVGSLCGKSGTLCELMICDVLYNNARLALVADEVTIRRSGSSGVQRGYNLRLT